MIADEGLELLDDDECRRLLASESLGRIGISVGALPAIFPVNYTLIDGDIYFRTGEGLKQRAALDQAVVAFEVDHTDPVRHQGWSVLVVGLATEIPVEDPALGGGSPVPWARGDRQHTVRVHPEFISGRRITPPS